MKLPEAKGVLINLRPNWMNFCKNNLMLTESLFSRMMLGKCISMKRVRKLWMSSLCAMVLSQFIKR